MPSTAGYDSHPGVGTTLYVGTLNSFVLLIRSYSVYSVPLRMHARWGGNGPFALQPKLPCSAPVLSRMHARWGGTFRPSAAHPKLQCVGCPVPYACGGLLCVPSCNAARMFSNLPRQRMCCPSQVGPSCWLTSVFVSASVSVPTCLCVAFVSALSCSRPRPCLLQPSEHKCQQRARGSPQQRWPKGQPWRLGGHSGSHAPCVPVLPRAPAACSCEVRVQGRVLVFFLWCFTV